jgi:hypothetical protein
VLAATVLVVGALTALPARAAAAPALFRISPTALDFGDVGVGSTSAQQPITVTNLSADPVVMSGAGGGAGVFGGVQDCQGETLAPHASCHMYYAFTPTALGTATGTASGSWNGQPYTIHMTGNGIDRFRISPTALSFGAVPVGGHSAQQRITITNTSRTPAVMSGAGGGAGVFGGVQDCQGETVAPGASCHMYYQFSPTAAGRVVVSAGGTWNGQPFAFHLTGNGDGTPEVRISPTALDFGSVPRGATSAQQTITLTNRTSAGIATDPVGIAAARFGGATDCPATLAAAASCHLFYAFTPSALGPAAATAEGTIAGRAFHFSFAGNGVRRYLVSPTGFDFGSVKVGHQSPPQSVLIKNLSAQSASLHLLHFAVAGFPHTTTCTSMLAGNASCRVTYTFAPTAPGLVQPVASPTVSGQQLSLRFRGTGT